MNVRSRLLEAAYAQLPTSDCVAWEGRSKDRYGYGRVTVKRRTLIVHRHVYEVYKGPIPNGLQLDHLCRNTSCVNPAHLEPVTAAENNRRALQHRSPVADVRTHCKWGHERSAENTYTDSRGQNFCRPCSVRRSREYKQRRQVSL